MTKLADDLEATRGLLREPRSGTDVIYLSGCAEGLREAGRRIRAALAESDDVNAARCLANALRSVELAEKADGLPDIVRAKWAVIDAIRALGLDEEDL